MSGQGTYGETQEPTYQANLGYPPDGYDDAQQYDPQQQGYDDGDHYFDPDTAIPRTVDEMGISPGLVQDLVLRRALVEGKTSTLSLASHLAMNPVMMTKVIDGLRDMKYLEVLGIEGRNYIVQLTGIGRENASERMTLCRYAGPAPVSLESYTRVIRRQSIDPEYDLPSLREAFSDMVIDDSLLSSIGPAAMGRGAMFMYGPPGTGKSSIAQRLQRVHNDYVYVPYAVEVDSQIITVFDPVVHRPTPQQPNDIDPRWIVCERPFITVGGELVGSQLDLSYQVGSGTYLAPLQMQANNGILVIDDFGRQALKPEALLNRWIVPLDRDIDYLSLEYGVKFEVPFDAKIVFSTNLAPEALGDEAFFRRIQSKVLIPPIRDDDFEEVLRRVAASRGIEVTAAAPTHLRWMSRTLGDGDLRPYLPGAVCNILETICRFEHLPLLLDPAMIDRIAKMYFTQAAEKAQEQEMEHYESVLEASMAEDPGFLSKPKKSMFSAQVEETAVEDDTSSGTSWAAAAAAALRAETGDLPLPIVQNFTANSPDGEGSDEDWDTAEDADLLDSADTFDGPHDGDVEVDEVDLHLDEALAEAEITDEEVDTIVEGLDTEDILGGNDDAAVDDLPES